MKNQRDIFYSYRRLAATFQCLPKFLLSQCSQGLIRYFPFGKIAILVWIYPDPNRSSALTMRASEQILSIGVPSGLFEKSPEVVGEGAQSLDVEQLRARAPEHDLRLGE